MVWSELYIADARFEKKIFVVVHSLAEGTDDGTVRVSRRFNISSLRRRVQS
jgi:hypothetical protein